MLRSAQHNIAVGAVAFPISAKHHDRTQPGRGDQLGFFIIIQRVTVAQRRQISVPTAPPVEQIIPRLNPSGEIGIPGQQTALKTRKFMKPPGCKNQQSIRRDSISQRSQQLSPPRSPRNVMQHGDQRDQTVCPIKTG